MTKPEGVAAVHHELETNFFGLLASRKALAPVLASNSGCTSGLRNELCGHSTKALGFTLPYLDTDTTKGGEVPKTGPKDVCG
jgi:hypothetical protein